MVHPKEVYVDPQELHKVNITFVKNVFAIYITRKFFNHLYVCVW